MSPPPSPPGAPSEGSQKTDLWAAIAASTAGWMIAGAGIAGFTLRLNPHLFEVAGDPARLLALFVAAYGLFGAVLGGLAGVPLALLASRTPRRLLAAAVGTLAVLGPFYVALLPAAGWTGDLLVDLLFGASLGRGVLVGLAIAAVAVVLGGGLAALLGIVAQALGRRPGQVATPAFVVLLAAIVATALSSPAPAPLAPLDRRGASGESVDSSPSGDEAQPDPVVLLCIDGADLEILEPLAAAGELPTFAELMRRGTWGPLSTLEPTLSAVVWTSLATGKEPAAHGIHHFVNFQLPGLRQSVHEFPLLTGLNFHVFKWLDRVPGMPRLRRPYTSNMRRAEALWTIVERRHPVGVYRWLVSWPAEPIDGFNVAGRLVADFEIDLPVGTDGAGRGQWPADLMKGIERPPRRRLGDEALEGAVGGRLGDDDPRRTMVRRSLADPTGELLPQLRAKYQPRLTMAAFDPIDPYSHHFGRDHGRDGPFADAVNRRYREVDHRLGRFLRTLEKPVHLIVVSDHGYDYENNHHASGPPGIFIGRGPAFPEGQRVDGLSVYDVAPMVLRLLDMPLPEDMPGTTSGRYRAALQPSFLERRPERRIATYETGADGPAVAVPSDQDDALEERLRSLGYIDR